MDLSNVDCDLVLYDADVRWIPPGKNIGYAEKRGAAGMGCIGGNSSG